MAEPKADNTPEGRIEAPTEDATGPDPVHDEPAPATPTRPHRRSAAQPPGYDEEDFSTHTILRDK